MMNGAVVEIVIVQKLYWLFLVVSSFHEMLSKNESQIMYKYMYSDKMAAPVAMLC